MSPTSFEGPGGLLTLRLSSDVKRDSLFNIYRGLVAMGEVVGAEFGRLNSSGPPNAPPTTPSFCNKNGIFHLCIPHFGCLN